MTDITRVQSFVRNRGNTKGDLWFKVCKLKSSDFEYGPAINYPEDKLPPFIKTKVALLNTFDPKPPNPWVDGIGQRVAIDVYWIDMDGYEDE